MSAPRRKKVSDAIRILQRKRDASARATHLKAEIGMVPNSTIERKIMSTKTSIKRVALVAAAALTLGGFSAVSANAASAPATPFYVSAADSTSFGAGNNAAAMTATAIAGPYNYVQIQGTDTLTAGATLGVAVSGATLVVAANNLSGVDTLTANSAGTVATSTHTGTGLFGSKINILTPTAGIVTVTISKNVDSSGTVTNTVLQTLTITVGAASVVGAYSAANSYALRVDTNTVNPAYFGLVETATGLSSSFADSATAISKGTIGSPAGVAIIAVKLMDTQATAQAIKGATISASLTGAGLIRGTGIYSDTQTTFSQSASTVASSTTAASGFAFFNVLTSGAAGVGTITFTYTDGNGVSYTIGSKSITFYGSLASLKATQGKYIVAIGGTTGGTTSTTYAVQFTATDSTGNAVDITSTGLNLAGSIVGTSDSTSNIASTTSQTCATDAVNVYALDCSVAGGSGATAGAVANVTYSYTDASAVKYSTSPVAFTMGSTTIAALSLTFDKASYNIGDIVTATITAKDSKGNLVADKSYTVFDTTTSSTVFTTSAQLTSSPFGSAYVTFKKGVATATFYAPYSSGTFNLTATTNNAVVAPVGDLASAAQGVALAGSFAISSTGGDASLALDAANAATDAANNAYDEAQNATQAASDALAAVKALAVQVKALIALVTKIKNKVGA